MAKSTRLIKFLACSDLHGDKQDPSSVQALLKYDAMFKPDIRLFLGDLWDFRPLRRGACQDERAQSMMTDYYAGIKFLKTWRPNFFVRGNHDQRLWDLTEGQGVEADFAMRGVHEIEDLCKKMRIQMLPYHKSRGVLRVANSSLKVLHGFNAGIYAARQTALTYGACLFGHVHTVDEHSIPGIDRRVARCIGAMCELDMKYNERQPSSLRHSNGFASGVILPDGSYIVSQAEKIGQNWITPTEFKSL